MNAQFDLDFGDAEHGGIFFVTSEDLEPLGEAAGMQSLRVCRIDLADYADQETLFDRLTQPLQLPADFGRNWDALADSMRDLSWLKATTGYILLFDHADAMQDRSEEDFDTLLDVLEEAVDFWQEAQTPFFVFFALPESAFDDTDA